MIFIDTGAFIAKYLQKDQFHKKSLQLWKRLEKKKHRFYTTNFIINETATLLGRWAGAEFASNRIRNLYGSTSFVIIRPELKQELAALDLMEKYSDHSIGFTDTLSFVLMNENNIKDVFTFDEHFRYAGFRIWK